MDAIPFWMRILALVLLMAIVATIELCRYGRQARRWREYGFVLALGFIAGVIGLANDLITSWLSPHYFIFGKGLPADNLRRSVATLGFQAGFTAGVIAAAVCLYINTRKASVPGISFLQIAMMIWRPLVLALAGALLLPMFFSHLDPLGFTPQLTGLLTGSQIAGFILVWWIHLGLYFGLTVGVIWMLVRIAQMRRTSLQKEDVSMQEKSPKIYTLVPIDPRETIERLSSWIGPGQFRWAIFDRKQLTLFFGPANVHIHLTVAEESGVLGNDPDYYRPGGNILGGFVACSKDGFYYFDPFSGTFPGTNAGVAEAEMAMAEICKMLQLPCKRYDDIPKKLRATKSS